MTEDVSRGLALLADEAEPAPIDSHDVIIRARARTRRSRSLAAVFAAVVMIGASAVTIQADQWTEHTAVQRQEDHAKKLTAQLAAALPGLIPAQWEVRPAPKDDNDFPPPNTFVCGHPGNGPEYGWVVFCDAPMWYRDAVGDIDVSVGVSNFHEFGYISWPESVPEKWTLPDGTQVRTDLDTGGMLPWGHEQSVEALRPDGTLISVRVRWKGDRPLPMTIAEMTKFMDKFNY
jgi:hypothetical protein